MLKQSPSRTGPIGRCAAAVVGTALGVLMVAGCAAGQDAQTVGQRPPIDGASASAGNIAVRAAAVLPPDAGPSYPKGGTASLQLVLVNNSSTSDTLTAVSSPTAGGAQLSTTGTSGSAGASTGSSAGNSPSASSSDSTSASASGSASATGSSATSSSGATPSASAVSQPITIPAGGSVKIGYGSGGPSVSLTGLTAELFPAQAVPLTLTFGSGATVTLTVPVMLVSQPPSAPVVSDATAPTE